VRLYTVFPVAILYFGTGAVNAQVFVVNLMFLNQPTHCSSEKRTDG